MDSTDLAAGTAAVQERAVPAATSGNVAYLQLGQCPLDVAASDVARELPAV